MCQAHFAEEVPGHLSGKSLVAWHQNPEVLGKEGEGSSQGTCIKDSWTKTTRVGVLTESGSWGMSRAGESNGGKMGTTVIEQQ